MISSLIRKPTVDIFPQREFSKKGKWKLPFDSYKFISKHVECVVLMSRVEK
jgi:hypothetical protein